MGSGQLGTLVHHLRRLADVRPTTDLTDSRLLQAFTASHDEAAFAALMKRHGRMVWSVCRHVLRQEQDAEDAFQATFLVLARKAGSIRSGESVASWLHGVAYRTAMNAKRQAARRRAREKRVLHTPPTPSGPDVGLRELQAILDEEVNGLPEKYRAPFVLCALEGKSKAEAARELGWKEGTVSSRLARARERLRQRLGRRGVELPAVLAALALSRHTASAAVPAKLVSSTLQAALVFAAGKTAAVSAPVVTLAEGVLRATALPRFKTALAVLLLLSMLGTTAGALSYRAFAAKHVDAQQAATKPAAKASGGPKAVEKDPAGTVRFGDPLPVGAISRLGTVRFRLGSMAQWLVFSADGKTLASDGLESFGLWDVATGRERGRVHHSSNGWQSHALAPDGKLLAGVQGNRLRFWDVATGKEVRPFAPVKDLVMNVAFSPHGRWLATWDLNKTISLRDARRGTLLQRFTVDRGWYTLAFSRDGRLLAAHDAGTKTIRVWEAATGKEQKRFPAEDASALLFSADGKTLITGGRERLIRLWDRASGKEVGRLKGDGDLVNAIALSPDGKSLASGSYNGTVRLWDLARRRELRRWPARANSAVAFAPDGKLLATSSEDGTLRLWDTATGRERLPQEGLDLSVNWVAFGPGGRTVVTAGGAQFIVWDPRTGRPRRVIEGRPREWGHRLSPDGGTLATTNSGDGSIGLWDLASGKQTRRFAGKGQAYWTCTLSPDGRLLAATRRPDTVQLWDLASGKEVRRMHGEGMNPPVAFSPDGRTLATIHGSSMSNARTVRLWDTATGKERWRRLTGSWHPGDLAFSANGRLLAVAGSTFDVQAQTYLGLWDPATGKEIRRCEEHGDYPSAVAFSPDSRTLATGHADKTVRLWEVASGKERRRLAGHQGEVVLALSFSPDGRLLASADYCGTGLVWDLTGRFSDGRFQPRPLSARELEGCWTDLAAADAARAYQGVLALAGSPRQAIRLLKDRLRPATAPDPDHISRLVAALDSRRFSEREQAIRELEKLGLAAEPALRRALQAKPMPEVRRRAEQLLDKLSVPSSQQLRAFRAVEVLESIGTPDAQEVLKAVAQGAPDARLTQEAKDSLGRLAGKPSSSK